MLRDALDLARQRGSRGWLLQFLQSAAGYATYTGEWDEADRILAEMAATDLPTAGKVTWASVSANLLSFRGETDEAAARLAEVAEARLGDDPRNPGWKANDEAFVELMAGRVEQAYATLIDRAAENLTEVAVFAGEWASRAALWNEDAVRARRASQLYDAVPERGRFVATIQLALRSGVKALEGDREGALAGYREAIRLFRDMDVEFYAALSNLELAIVLGPDEPEAVAAGEEARAYWTRLGSLPLLARLDEGLERSESKRSRPDKAPNVASEAETAEPATAKP
jgi:hypothetical protein